MHTIAHAFARFMSGWGFPTFLIFVLLFAQVLLAAVLFVPAESTPLERFAEDFKVWCFGYDPATGEIQWAYVVSMLTSPFLLMAFTLMIWWEPLRDLARSGPRRVWRSATPAAVLVLALAAGMGMLGTSTAEADLAFPAERLRTSHEPPAFELVDQHGEPVSLASLEGRVVILTGVYATCGLTCPMILSQARGVVSSLSPAARDQVTVVAITLDPENDDPAKMRAMAEAQGVRAPVFRLTTGEPDEVEGLLDALGFQRRRDPETGIIDHANLFLVIDKRGRIAYRFSLGEQQGRWLGEAVELLASEPVVGADEPGAS